MQSMESDASSLVLSVSPWARAFLQIKTAYRIGGLGVVRLVLVTL